MADMDLGTALNMFKDGVNSLALTNAVNSANDQVNQIKSTVTDQAQQRSQMQQVSNNLVAHMATFGTPATTIDAVSKAIGPKQYANANQMNMDATLTGNKQLADQASDQQDFENDKSFELAKMKIQARNNPLAQMQADEKVKEFNTKQFANYGSDLDASKASSRTSFGKWQQVADNGSRLQAIIGKPDAPKTPQELALAADALGQMVKGSALTEGDQKTLHAAGLKIAAAQEAAKLTGGPVKVDLSDWSKLYSSVADREDTNAKSQQVQTLVQKVNNRASLATRDPDQFKLTTASAFARQGINISPDDVQIDPKKGVQIKGVTDVLDDARQAGTAVKKALGEAKSGSPMTSYPAIKFLNDHNIPIDSDPKTAADNFGHKIRSKIFQ